MIKDIRRHRAEPAGVVDDVAMKRQDLTEVHAALTPLAEMTIGPHQLRVGRQERKAAAFRHMLRRRLAMILLKHRLRTEKLQLARATGHKHVDDVLRSRRILAGTRLHRPLCFRVVGQ